MSSRRVPALCENRDSQFSQSAGTAPTPGAVVGAVVSATAAADYINLIKCLQSSSPTWHYPCAKGGGARLSFAHAGLEACSCLLYLSAYICWWWAQWCCELWLGSVEKSERGGRLRPRGAPARSAAEKRRAKNSKGGGAARDPPNALGVPLTGDHCFGRRGAPPAQAGEKQSKWAWA